MIEVPVFNQSGQEIEKLQVDESKLGGKVNKALLKQAIVMYHANKRQGTVKTRGRGEVAGSTRKLYKQKGTGNARTGGIRNPIKVGGGHAKQKQPKEWRLTLPKKARRAARNSALLAKLLAKDVKVVDGITLAEAKTKQMALVFKALGIDRSCLLATDGRNEVVERSARNIDRATVTTVAQLNAWDLLKSRTLLLTKAGLEAILAGKVADTAADTAAA
jgi:large subunit ribosomal protein L4